MSVSSFVFSIFVVYISCLLYAHARLRAKFWVGLFAEAPLQVRFERWCICHLS